MNPASFSDVSAFILAGGGSRRMGRDKAFLPLGGRSILARILEALRPLVENVFIVANDKIKYEMFGVRVIIDLREGKCGPLAGIESALTCCQTPNALVLACDLPLISTEFLRFLLERRGDRAVVPESVSHGDSPGLLSGVCAVYPRSTLPIATDLLNADIRRLDAFLERIPLKIATFAEYAHLSNARALLTNVNTPDQYASALHNQ